MKNFKVLNIIFSSSATVYNSSEIDNKALSENNLT
jgi:UDP-glucose 4-epimerase